MELLSFLPQSATDTAAAVPSSTQSVGIADNFDTFLTLLTSQIQNQDPLSPVESNEFTNQLVQFSQVEQQIRTNAQFDSLLAVNRASTGAALSGYLGREAEIVSDIAGFSGTPLTWVYRLPDEVASANLAITDASGQLVYSTSVSADSGRGEFSWDGRTTSGTTAPDGPYRLSVQAADANGDPVSAPVGVLADVVGIDLSHGDPAIATAVGIYAYADIARVSAP